MTERKRSTKNSKDKILRIVSEVVVDREGNVIGNNPKDFPIITNKCKALIASLETGMDYKVV